MKNEDIYRKEIFDLIKAEVLSETDDSRTKELLGKLFMTINDELDSDNLIKDILSDE
jgi:hypothetical protein